ncbi:hypothetical protein SAMN05421770_102112 [Granulicella rosea]|uniref:Circularly permuted type 2 ATP-grasp protein n=1 Tax=Granulicella rosea TaxID=474952 RepID=A0A239GX05_9BACT|nr:hypothetical protein [Granulicella rosea]SNS73422.1 hypothetical protein SAMN05421770_102112 [Granulicella rosea]
MLQPLRAEFNQTKFSPERYAALVEHLCERTRARIEFRICETPVFLPQALLEEMADAGRVLTHQLIDNPEYMRLSDGAIPERYRLGNDNPRPNFMTVDFGVVRGEDGLLRPKLVELQAFPSVFGYQDLLARSYREVYGLDPSLSGYLDGHTEASYWELLRRTIVGSHDPRHVVLLEVDPEGQKTLPDFHVYEDRLSIATVDIAKVKQEGRRLFYQRDGEWIAIKRIFNRTIVDELERRGIVPGFDYRDELDVEWAGHPNWYFRISKFSIPHLHHPSVPTAVFLDDWFAGRGRDRLPESREEILLKPLYSFAGKGIQFAPTDAELAAIPEADRSLYLLQERVHFEPLIETPFGMTQAEVRIMYVWPDDEPAMRPLISLVRLGRGLMMGVDHNRNQEWVGGSAALVPKQL